MLIESKRSNKKKKIHLLITLTCTHNQQPGIMMINNV